MPIDPSVAGAAAPPAATGPNGPCRATDEEAMAQTGANRTEKPTAKKRRDARRKGMAARSSELPQAVSLVVAALVLPVLLPPLVQRMAEIWQAAVSPDAVLDPATPTATLGRLLWEAVQVFVPLVVLTAGASVAAQLALTGGRPNPHKLKPQWSNLNPVKGLKRLLSVQVLWDLGRTIAKLVLLAAVTWGLYAQTVERVLGGGRVLSSSLDGIGTTMRDLLVRAAAAAVVIGVADALFNKARFSRQLRMTKQEVKEELKQQEASPFVKAEIRRRQALLSRNRMIAAVSGADVVVTNPTHLAVALGYEETDGAPRVLAKGAGVVAERIRDEARRHGVPIREEKLLARTMFRTVEVGELIPVELFAAVAAVLAAVYRARRR